MASYSIMGRNPFFQALDGLNVYNRSDDKVGMVVETDMSSAFRLRDRYAARGLRKPSFTALVARAVALALREQPHANRMPFTLPGYKRIVQFHDVHVMVAVEKDWPGHEQAVFVGNLRHADRLGLSDMTELLQGFAHANETNCSEWRMMLRILRWLPAFLVRRVMTLPFLHPRLWVAFHGGAVLISSPAKYGIDVMMGTWPWPLGISFGVVRDRPVALQGRVAVRPVMNLTLSFDRRLMGGAPAARFLKAVARNLEEAEARMDEGAPQEEPGPARGEPQAAGRLAGAANGEQL